MNCILLIGYRGVGKSTIAEIITDKLDFKKISLDKLLSEEIGGLQDYIKKFGWEKFRDAETEMIKRLNCSNSVIDCGGGVIERPVNMEYLSELGTIFYLKASSETIKDRLLTTNPRLSLSGSSVLTEIDEVLSRRDPLYTKYADYIIETDKLTIEESADEIIKKTQK